MDIFIQCGQSLDRTALETALRTTISSALKAEAEVVFKYSEAPTNKVDVLLPQLNGELKIRADELTDLVFAEICRVFPLGSGAVECRMRDTHNGGSRSW